MAKMPSDTILMLFLGLTGARDQQGHRLLEKSMPILTEAAPTTAAPEAIPPSRAPPTEDNLEKDGRTTNLARHSMASFDSDILAMKSKVDSEELHDNWGKSSCHVSSTRRSHAARLSLAVGHRPSEVSRPSP